MADQHVPFGGVFGDLRHDPADANAVVAIPGDEYTAGADFTEFVREKLHAHPVR